MRRSLLKGISASIVALIFLIAGVIMAIVLSGYMFGVFGAISFQPTVKEVGPGYLYPCEPNNHPPNYVVSITLDPNVNLAVKCIWIPNLMIKPFKIYTQISTKLYGLTQQPMNYSAGKVIQNNILVPTSYFNTSALSWTEYGKQFFVYLYTYNGNVYVVSVTYEFEGA